MPPPNTPASDSDSEVPPNAVNIASLSAPQLRALQTRLSTELEHLTSSHAKLRAAQSRFRDCVRSINDGVVGNAKKGTEGKDEILVPLTSSLYVKGRLTEREKVLVDVGTGYFVEKTAAKAIEFYEAKVKELETNLTELEKLVSTKSQQQRLFEDALRQKLMSEATASSAQAAAAG
ncbi:prefoldin subunit 5 [Aspergillus undulatus]|uniref:prefoldin subunit 5 n=1 Tax=Aspergillus undulatus TaxID=1810928 RepID=UPI003CCCDC31